MIVDHAGHKQVSQELSALANKEGRLSKQEERRFAVLKSHAASLRDGAWLRDLELEDANEIRRQYRIPEVAASGLTVNQERRAKTFRGLLRGEIRTMLEGDPGARIGTYNTTGGTFVPTGFMDRLYSAMGEHDALFDEDACTVIRTDNGHPIPVPVAGDITVKAQIVNENSARTPVDLASTGHAQIGAFTFDSKPWHISLEATQDLQGALSQMTIAETAFASRLARGIGERLILGEGSGEPLGILATLDGLGVTPVDAIGAQNNTGDDSQNNANSIGLQDIANLIGALDSVYLASSKAALLMNRGTLSFLNGLTSKMGTSVGIVQWVKGKPFICGLPVRVSPSMPSIEASSTPILVGDFSYWCTRLVNAGDSNGKIGLQVYQETVGLIENGLVGVSAFTRASGALLYNGIGGPSPVLALKMGS
jgi:HK97 family phage major capsid protein